MLEVLSACAKLGHVGEDAAFSFNDMDDGAFVLDVGCPGIEALGLWDQNRRTLTFVERDADGGVAAIDVHVYHKPAAEWFERNFEEGIDERSLKWAAGMLRHHADPGAVRPRLDLGGVVDAYLKGGVSPSRLARFERGPDGTLVCTVPPGLDSDSVKTWNGYVFEIGSASCCLEEKYGADRPRG